MLSSPPENILNISALFTLLAFAQHLPSTVALVLPTSTSTYRPVRGNEPSRECRDLIESRDKPLECHLTVLLNRFVEFLFAGKVLFANVS